MPEDTEYTLTATVVVTGNDPREALEDYAGENDVLAAFELATTTDYPAMLEVMRETIQGLDDERLSVELSFARGFDDTADVGTTLWIGLLYSETAKRGLGDA